MPEDSFQEKTEPATARKREKARNKGQVAKSPEISSALTLLAGVIILRLLAPGFYQHLSGLMIGLFRNVSQFEITEDNIRGYLIVGILGIAKIIGPLLGGLVLVAVGSQQIQVGFLFTLEPLQPKFSQLDPVKGLSRIFSSKSFVKLLVSLIKLIIIGTVAYLTIKAQLNNFLPLLDMSVGQILIFMGRLIFLLTIRVSLAMLFLAMADYAYQKWEYEKSLRMTKKEVEDERKELEGDPKIKARIRSIQRRMAKQRMMDEVPKADVVITNPTSLAIALKYDAGSSSAPLVIAKGARLLAERIKEIAESHDIPIVENKSLAQALYKSVEIGYEIPDAFYRAVAEVLSYVYQLGKKFGRRK